MSYFIVTDSACDLSEDRLRELKVGRCALTANFQDGKVLEDSFSQMSAKEFFDGMRSGTMSSTAQVNSSLFYDMFKHGLAEYDRVVYIGLSEALSGTFQSAVLARITLEEDYPESAGKVSLIDTKSVSLGQGLLVLEACRKRDEGMAFDDLVRHIEHLKDRINQFITVEDLVYLKRGGRISGFKAAVGHLLDIKPLLYVNQEGRLHSFDKAKGRKKSIQALAKRFHEMYDPALGKDFAISHGDCLEEAQYLVRMLREEHDLNEPVIEPVGMVVGSHSGPGTIALFFPGKPRGEIKPNL